MQVRAATAALACTLLHNVAATAQATLDDELDRIPKVELNSTQATSGDETSTQRMSSTTLRTRFHLENVVTGFSTRDDLLVPLPTPNVPGNAIENRTSADDVSMWNVAPRTTLTLSDRLNADVTKYARSSTDTVMGNDFREGFIAWQRADRFYLEAGRINIRNGVAEGFNPTDFFKTFSAISLESADPVAVRDDRLGVVALNAQYLWTEGSLGFVYAPKLAGPAPISISSGSDEHLNPLFDRTNAANRFLLTTSSELFGCNPQLLVYREDDHTSLGLDVSRALGQHIVAYLEWAGGRQLGLRARAVEYGEATGAISAAAVPFDDSGGGTLFRNDVAVGASYATASRLTINLEYHYDQSGWSHSQWQQAFEQGQASPASAGALFWYVRQFANDMQEPVSRQQLFLRLSYTNPGPYNFELSGFVFVDPGDGSRYTQLSGSYYWSDRWTFGAFATVAGGSRRSEYGSVPHGNVLSLKVTRYFGAGK